ncbi:MAG: hypothetical protein ACRKGH_07480 [Dehalogenimonas sp.]
MIGLLGLVLAATGCQVENIPEASSGPDNLSVEYINADQAIDLVNDIVPGIYSDRFTFTAEQIGNVWEVQAALYHNVLTVGELDWPVGEFNDLNYGLLPEGEFRLLVIELDAESGEVRSLTASDSLAMPEGDLLKAVSPACGGCE